MADASMLLVTILETGNKAENMALEHKSMMMAEHMWVPGKTKIDMVKGNKPIKKAQSSKENG